MMDKEQKYPKQIMAYIFGVVTLFRNVQKTIYFVYGKTSS